MKMKTKIKIKKILRYVNHPNKTDMEYGYVMGIKAAYLSSHLFLISFIVYKTKRAGSFMVKEKFNNHIIFRIFIYSSVYETAYIIYILALLIFFIQRYTKL